MSSNGTSALRCLLLSATVLAAPGMALAGGAPGTLVPSGQLITIPNSTYGASYQTLNPGLADHPTYQAGQALNTVLSPDGSTLLVLTSGYNLLNYSSGPNAGQGEPSASNEYVFVYNVIGTFQQNPHLVQVIQVPNSFIGLTWAPASNQFYVSGGANDDVLSFTRQGAFFAQTGSVALGHPHYGAGTLVGSFLGTGIGFVENAASAGLALTPDGATLAVTNIYNDSISSIDTASGTVNWEYDLRPFNNNPAAAGTAGGETPFAVAIAGTAATGYTAYVTALRDREVDVVPLGASAPAQGSIVRIALPGSPNRLVLSPDQSKLYVAQDNSDTVAVISTATNTVIEEIPTAAPPGLIAVGSQYTGAAPNSVALSPDGNTLYVTNGGANSVAVIPLGGTGPHTVAGLIPTGWYPHAVTVSADGKTLFVVNGKSQSTKNPGYENGADNEYVEQIEHGGLLAIKVPGAAALAKLTQIVATNNSYGGQATATDAAVMAALHAKIQHVIYIIKENRTFDQILGDIHNGAAADPNLVMYGYDTTPNFHHVSDDFVTLDHFFTAGEVSGDGWAWSTEGRESDFGTKTIPMNYANRGSSNDCEGSNRVVDVGLNTSDRIAAFPFLGSYSLYGLLGSELPGGYLNLLPGTNDDFATDGPAGTPAQQGYLWDSALRAGLTVRNYGFFNDIVRYNIPLSVGGSPLTENPALQSPPLVMAWPSNPTLAPYTDPYFRGFDNAYPDGWRWEEWNREFQAYVSGGNLPALSLVRFMHDHTGNFSTAAGGINTPELDQADNDLAVGKLIQTVANSPYGANTLIFVLEDDSQDGPDHINSHRSTAYVAGPYVAHNKIVTTVYNTVNMVRTIEDVLGIGHLNINDATARPMTDVFDLNNAYFTYTNYASGLLVGTGDQPLLPTNPSLITAAAAPAHNAAWWAAKTKGYDWSKEDRIPAEQYNRILWEGIKGGKLPAEAATPVPGDKDD